MTSTTRLAAWTAGLFLAAACAGQRAGEGELDAEMDQFYAAWEAEIVDAMAELDDDDVAALRSIWPRAEFEGATADVLAVLETEPAVRPMTVRLQRFLQFGVSNRVRDQLRTEAVDRRAWHVLVDTVNRELAARAG